MENIKIEVFGTASQWGYKIWVNGRRLAIAAAVCRSHRSAFNAALRAIREAEHSAPIPQRPAWQKLVENLKKHLKRQ